MREILKSGVNYSSRLDILSSFFAGSILAKAFSKILLSHFNLGGLFFTSKEKIPGFTAELAAEKAYDISEFLLIIFFTLGVYIFNLALASIRRRKVSALYSSLFLFSMVILFWEATFLSFSSLRLGLSTLVVFVLYNFYRPKSFETVNKINFKVAINGLLLGFYLLILISSLITSVSIPLIFFIAAPIIYILFDSQTQNKTKNPPHLIFLFSAFFPYRVLPLAAIGLIFLLIKFLLPKLKIRKKKRLHLLYIFSFVFIFAFNPLFYLGSFDPIEEGFWLGWLQRLLSGQSLYKDVAVYQPPGLVWGLYIFSKVFGSSIYIMRLYFHILKIFGLFIIYLLASQLIKKNVTRVIVFLTILALSTTQVRNNVEFRVALGILSLLVFYEFIKTKKKHFIVISGFLSSFAIFLSLETGIAVIIAISFSLLFFSGGRERLKSFFNYALGLILGALPFVFVLYTTESIWEFLKQLQFYSQAFASGYLNSSISRIGNLTLIQWHVAYKYFDSLTWFWELALLGILSALMGILYKFFSKGIGAKEKYIFSIAVFALILSRVVLGRSDVYHLLFILPISLILLANFLESLFKTKRIIYVAMVFVVINLFFFRTAVNLNFLQEQLIKFQSYGNPPGNYPNFDLKRANILTGIDTNVEKEKLVINYIQEETTKKDAIFVYPWNPEVYFLADRMNSTSFDTPLAFYSDFYQQQMIEELEKNIPKLILYNPSLRLGNLTPGSLELVDNYIKDNYKQVNIVGKFNIYKHI